MCRKEFRWAARFQAARFQAARFQAEQFQAEQFLEESSPEESFQAELFLVVGFLLAAATESGEADNPFHRSYHRRSNLSLQCSSTIDPKSESSEAPARQEASWLAELSSEVASRVGSSLEELFLSVAGSERMKE